MEKERRLYKTTSRGGRPTKYPGVEVLTELYINQNLTASEIGQRYGVSQNTVRNWLIKARKEVASE